MRLIAALTLTLAQCSAPVPAWAIDLVDGQAVLLPAERETMTRCAAQGGCTIVTRTMMEAYGRAIVDAYEKAVVEVFKSAVADEVARICKKTI